MSEPRDGLLGRNSSIRPIRSIRLTMRDSPRDKRTSNLKKSERYSRRTIFTANSLS